MIITVILMVYLLLFYYFGIYRNNKVFELRGQIIRLCTEKGKQIVDKRFKRNMELIHKYFDEKLYEKGIQLDLDYGSQSVSPFVFYDKLPSYTSMVWSFKRIHIETYLNPEVIEYLYE